MLLKKEFFQGTNQCGNVLIPPVIDGQSGKGGVTGRWKRSLDGLDVFGRKFLFALLAGSGCDGARLAAGLLFQFALVQLGLLRFTHDGQFSPLERRLLRCFRNGSSSSQ